MTKHNVLWRYSTHDGMLNGLVLYNNEKVWAECIDHGGYMNTEDDIKDEKVLKELEKRGLSFLASGEDIDLGDYEISVLETMLREKRKYKLYRLPSDVLQNLEYNHELWLKCSPNRDLYKEKRVQVDIKLSEYECIGVFYDTDFEEK